MWNYKCDRCGCALDPGERCDCGEAPADDKEVYTEDTFDYGKAKAGDYVSQDVVDNAVNCLPPACMRSDCTQLGEPYSHREDPNSGKWRPVFATFKRITYPRRSFYGRLPAVHGREPDAAHRLFL